MSTTASSPSVGGTLAGGIQDVAAILPLIGTDQCDKHLGSALTGGYLYAAAAPLSIFGSLGIVKAGISIFISSISVSIPRISLSFRDSKPSVKYHGKKIWLGGKMLKDAGFEMAGTVAPLIGMDGHRFKAETRLINMLEEKHIDDHEKVSIRWKSRQWNIMLVLSIILAAALSIAPYIALLLGPVSWQPRRVHLRWLYPILRIAGSCCTTVTTQLIIQSRVISLMKNRIVFMVMRRRLDKGYKAQLDAWLEDPRLQWDPDLPSEQCIQSLEQYFLSSNSPSHSVEDSGHEIHAPVQKEVASIADGASSAHCSILMTPPGPVLLSDLHQLQKEHFPSPIRDAAFTLFLWIVLGISLPSTVAGYIGCFTLVSATPSAGNGPLVWVALEAALSILRILIWASNPTFDEETEVTVELQLSQQQPMVTTNDYNPSSTDSDDNSRKPLMLVPENEFLGRITPFTGPLDQFHKADNITLYFTLTTEYEPLTNQWDFIKSSKRQSETMCLFMTIFDFNLQLGVTFVSSKLSSHYYDVTVKYNSLSQRLEASIDSQKKLAHQWLLEDDNLFHSLELYYRNVAGALKNRDINTPTAILPWKWDLSPQPALTNQRIENPHFSLPPVTSQNQLYLNQGYEHHLKSELIATWSGWVVTDMASIRGHTRFRCHEALKDATSEKAKWELTELDAQLAFGWARRELMILVMSFELEDILHDKMEACVSEICRARGEEQSGVWMRSESDIAWRKRLEQERVAAKTRMEKAMKDASEQANSEDRPWNENTALDAPLWEEIIDAIDQRWLAGINVHPRFLNRKDEEFNELSIRGGGGGRRRTVNRDRNDFVDRFKEHVSHDYWRSQHEIEEEMMQSTIERIRLLPANIARDQLDVVYDYPKPDTQATKKFVKLGYSSSKGKACSALVYDARTCDKDAVLDVIAKTTTRSVLNVDPQIVALIPPNEHLLFLSSGDGESVDLPFVQQNREAWWSQQTTNSATFYFTPKHIWNDNSCFCNTTQVVAHIFIFLTLPSTVRVRVIHRGEATKVSLLENGEELGFLSSPIPTKYQLHEFQSFVLSPGVHQLELVPQVDSSTRESRFYGYYLMDILIELSNDPTAMSTSVKSGPGVLAITAHVPEQG